MVIPKSESSIENLNWLAFSTNMFQLSSAGVPLSKVITVSLALNSHVPLSLLEVSDGKEATQVPDVVKVNVAPARKMLNKAFII